MQKVSYMLCYASTLYRLWCTLNSWEWRFEYFLLITCTSYNLMPWDKKNKKKKPNSLGKYLSKTIKMIATCRNLINFRICKACLTEDRLRSWKQLHTIHIMWPIYPVSILLVNTGYHFIWNLSIHHQNEQSQWCCRWLSGSVDCPTKKIPENLNSSQLILTHACYICTFLYQSRNQLVGRSTKSEVHLLIIVNISFHQCPTFLLWW